MGAKFNAGTPYIPMALYPYFPISLFPYFLIPLYPYILIPYILIPPITYTL